MYLVSWQISMTELFCRNRWRLLAMNIFWKKLHHRYLTGSLIRLWLPCTKADLKNFTYFRKTLMTQTSRGFFFTFFIKFYHHFSKSIWAAASQQARYRFWFIKFARAINFFESKTHYDIIRRTYYRWFKVKQIMT